ncbi:hypothetical protein [Treponema phagedenis]|nr:hypothetical protein [Treponema phagedenis]
MITHGRGYLFGFDEKEAEEEYPKYKNHLSLKVAKEDGDYNE